VSCARESKTVVHCPYVVYVAVSLLRSFAPVPFPRPGALSCRLSPSVEQPARLDAQSLREPPKHLQGQFLDSPFDLSDVDRVDTDAVGEGVLPPPALPPQPLHVPSHPHHESHGHILMAMASPGQSTAAKRGRTPRVRTDRRQRLPLVWRGWS